MKGFKTVAFNILLGGTLIARMFNPDAPLPDAETVAGTVDLVDQALATGLVVGNLVLRAVTNSPIFKKNP
jgi:hypothetical protein